mmetsp:Transcript_101249/g.281852  ORF Transcript_101249/g.281852 Transcript_101249/m.281852 type:complete len:158 (-) Transcript_101249:77-550(-)
MRLPMSSLIAPENAATKIMTCRICMETEPASDLCSPCLCRGSMKYVHSQCLQRWRSASTNQHSRYRCEQCQYPYSLSRIGASDFMLKPQVMDLGVKLALAAATAAVYALFAMAPTNTPFVLLRILVLGTMLFGLVVFSLTVFVLFGLHAVNPSGNVG